jgi:hypothetical protein
MAPNTTSISKNRRLIGIPLRAGALVNLLASLLGLGLGGGMVAEIVIVIRLSLSL